MLIFFSYAFREKIKARLLAILNSCTELMSWHIYPSFKRCTPAPLQTLPNSPSSELFDVTMETLEGYKDSDGPWLTGFFKEYGTKGTFKEAKLTGKVTSEKFASTMRSLVQNILKTFSSRYADVRDGVVQAYRGG